MKNEINKYKNRSVIETLRFLCVLNKNKLLALAFFFGYAGISFSGFRRGYTEIIYERCVKATVRAVSQLLANLGKGLVRTFDQQLRELHFLLQHGRFEIFSHYSFYHGLRLADTQMQRPRKLFKRVVGGTVEAKEIFYQIFSVNITHEEFFGRFYVVVGK